MLLNPLTFHAPKTLSEASKLYAELENVKLQAGGTFLLNALKLLKRKGTKTPDHVISLNKVDELKGISQESNHLIIKSMTTIDEIFDAPLKDNYSILKTVCRNISTQPIRNMATVGGNLTCRYTWTEMPAVMIGLGATMHFIDINGKEEILNSEDFFKDAAKTNKIFTHVSIPHEPQAKIAYRRVKKSSYVDIPMLSLLIKLNVEGGQIQNARVGINNCVNFAQRDNILEDYLNQNKLSKTLGQEALDHLDEKIYDTRSSDYKKHMFRVSIKNAIQEISENTNS